MEMGNIIFGNSRGEVRVDRDDAWTEALQALFDKCNPDGDGDYHGEAFENDVFRVFPYYWGDCTCGFEDKCSDWSDAHRHAEDCYQSVLARETKAMEKRIGYREVPLSVTVDPIDQGAVMMSIEPRPEWRDVYAIREREMDKLYRDLCKRFGIPWNDGNGCAVHCTCTHDRDWEQWVADKNHNPTCPIVIPNFHHKPSGYQLKWYKYPLRDSYANRELSTPEFLRMIDECKASVVIRQVPGR